MGVSNELVSEENFWVVPGQTGTSTPGSGGSELGALPKIASLSQVLVKNSAPFLVTQADFYLYDLSRYRCERVGVELFRGGKTVRLGCNLQLVGDAATAVFERRQPVQS